MSNKIGYLTYFHVILKTTLSLIFNGKNPQNIHRNRV